MSEDQAPRRPGAQPGLSSIERDVMTQSNQIAQMIVNMTQMQAVLNDLVIKEKVREVEDTHIDERFDRVEKRLDGITSLGRWILGAFGSTFIAAIAAFIAGGGLNLVK